MKCRIYLDADLAGTGGGDGAAQSPDRGPARGDRGQVRRGATEELL